MRPRGTLQFLPFPSTTGIPSPLSPRHIYILNHRLLSDFRSTERQGQKQRETPRVEVHQREGSAREWWPPGKAGLDCMGERLESLAGDGWGTVHGLGLWMEARGCRGGRPMLGCDRF